MLSWLADTDSYKFSHFLQYPPGTTALFSYLESRGGLYPKTVFFGLQYLLDEYLAKPIKLSEVTAMKSLVAAHGLPFNEAGWRRIALDLGGKLPIRIRAVPEGTVVPNLNALMTVESTDPDTFWIASYVETMLMRVWYPITVATLSWHCKETIRGYLERTSDDWRAELPFKLHDFGSRGVSSQETAAIGGAAHLVSFLGTDTFAGILHAQNYYSGLTPGASPGIAKMPGFSIPAAEHSTMTAWGREREAAAYANMLDAYAQPGRILAVVSDSYDLWNAIEKIWGGELRSRVIESGATLVIRPDSGHPPSVVLKSLELLESRFGAKTNTKGFKVLNHCRVIQGDGINHAMIGEILETITRAGYSASNVAFGMGGGLLQQVNRDTQRFAFKCSEATVNGQRVPVSKNPVTDPGKASKAGRLDLIRRGDQFETVRLERGQTHPDSELKAVFENGEVLKRYSLDEIRARAEMT